VDNPSDEHLLMAIAAGPGALPEFFRRHVAEIVGVGSRRFDEPEEVADFVGVSGGHGVGLHRDRRPTHGRVEELANPRAVATGPTKGTASAGRDPPESAFHLGNIGTVKGAAPGVRWHEAGNPEVMGREAVLQQMSIAIRRWPAPITLPPGAGTRAGPGSRRATAGALRRPPRSFPAPGRGLSDCSRAGRTTPAPGSPSPSRPQGRSSAASVCA
jgi:hypothetical protein